MTRPLRLLLIDDSLVDRQLAEEVFAEYAGLCTVRTCASGTAALEMLDSGQATLPDVILLDINMPGMNGFEVLAALKGHPRLAQIPVVMLSTSGHDSDVARAYTLHASSYLVKSVSFGDFVSQIESFLEFWRTSRLTTWPEMIAR
ncbi:response regulator [Deinococcus aestuarii]|uniref:response regulator n=1 Tax=Deinococcus aestuarii TaxID=2774531 RepID=UPI001C0D5199|nr:response regulator [Deinococcus aestuarii]